MFKGFSYSMGWLLLFGLLLTVSLGAQSQNRSGFLRESFTGQAFPPAGWRVQQVSGASSWEASDLFAYDDSVAAHSFAQSAGENWLIMPRFRVANDDSLVFRYVQMAIGFPVANADSLAIKISTTDSALTSFTRTLALFENNRNYPTMWFDRIKLDLSRYAGQQVYIAFKHVSSNGTGIAIDDVELGQLPTAEVRVVGLALSPRPVVGTSHEPRIQLQNLGASHQSIAVTLTITPGGYSRTQTVNLPSGRNQLDERITQTVVFPAWVPAGTGQHTITATAALSVDPLPADNTAQQVRQVYQTAGLQAWQSRAMLPETRYLPTLTSYRSLTGDTTYLLSIGGAPSKSSPPDGKVMRYSSRTRTWTTRAAQPQPLYGPSAQTIRGLVYVAGGGADTGGPIVQPTNQLNIYNPQLNTWTSGAPIPGPLADHASGVLGDSLLYLMGGSNGVRYGTTVYVYNPRLNTWASATPPPAEVAWVYVGTVGIAGNSIVLHYREKAWRGDINPNAPLQITWTQLPNYPAGSVERKAVAGSAAGGQRRVYFSGGMKAGTNSLEDETWAYDLNTDEWVSVPLKPTIVEDGLMTEVVTRDSVYLAQVGGTAFDGQQYGLARTHEWLPLGKLVGTPLPVTLVAYTARRQNQQVLLEWRTATEQHNAGFELSVSTDGQRFRPLARVAGAAGGFSAAERRYRYVDTAPDKHRVSYYRLEQRDTDGKLQQLGIRAVSADEQGASLAVAPNPFAGSTSAWLTLPTGTPAPVWFSLSDATGRVVWQHHTTASGTFRLDNIGQGLGPGLYVLQCRTAGQEMRTKLIKQ